MPRLITPSSTNALEGTAREGSPYTEQQHAEFARFSRQPGDFGDHYVPAKASRPATPAEIAWGKGSPVVDEVRVRCPILHLGCYGAHKIVLPGGDVRMLPRRF